MSESHHKKKKKMKSPRLPSSHKESLGNDVENKKDLAVDDSSSEKKSISTQVDDQSAQKNDLAKEEGKEEAGAEAAGGLGPAQVVVDNIIDSVHSISHIILGMIFAYFVGWLGFHVSWALLFAYIVYRLDQRSRSHQRARDEAQALIRRTHELERAREQERLVEIAAAMVSDEKSDDNSSQKSAVVNRAVLERQREQDLQGNRETADWLNAILIAFFPVYSPSISDSVEASVIQSIQAALATPPPGLTHVSVAGVSLGTTPPLLLNMKREKTVGHTYKLSFTLLYKGDAEAEIVVGVGKANKAFTIGADLPIVLRNISLVGRVSLTLTMATQPPLYKTMAICFKEKPAITFELEPGKLFSLDSIPGLQGFIDDSIISIVSDMMLYPRQFVVELGEGESPLSLTIAAEKAKEEQRKRDQAFLTSGAPSASDKKKEFDERIPEYIGKLNVVVRSAKRLRAADKKLFGKDSSDPYVKLSCGLQTFKTKVISKTLSPEWDETFEVLVESDEMYQKLDFEVFDEDKASSDDLLGRHRLSFVDIVALNDEEKHTETLELSGEDINTGELTIEYWFQRE